MTQIDNYECFISIMQLSDLETVNAKPIMFYGDFYVN